MEDNVNNVFDTIIDNDKNIIYRIKLHKLLEHCIQEIGALSISMANTNPEDVSYSTVCKRIKALQQREQFYQAQLASCGISASL